MERLTYDFALGGNHCWQVKGADNLECREVCERQGDAGCKTCPIAKAFDRLAAIEDILGDEYDLDLVQKLIQAYREGRYIILKEPEQAGISRLRELAQADREGRCVVLPDGGYKDKDGENALKSAMNTCFYHNNPVTRFIADAVAEKLTRAEAEAALRREQDEKGGGSE